MRSAIFNNYINKYAYFYNKLIAEIKAYEKAKKDYRDFTNIQKYKNWLRSPLIVLSPVSRKIILKKKAEYCKARKESVKNAQREFEKYRNQMMKTLKENGLVVY